MGIIDNAVTRALEIAADDSHGYDQTSRWGLTTIAAAL